MIKILHSLFERACVKTIVKNRHTRKMPWFFKILSPVEFWLRKKVKNKSPNTIQYNSHITVKEDKKGKKTIEVDGFRVW